MIDKQIIFMPSWVAEAITRNAMGHSSQGANIGMKFSAILDFAVISKILSPVDLAGMIVLQRQAADYVTGFALSKAKDMVPESVDLFGVWSAQARRDPELNEFFVSNIEPRLCTMDGKESNEARLFSEEGKLTQYDEPFITYDVDRDAAVIVIRPGFFTNQVDGSERLSLFIRATESVLNVFYTYMSRDDVSKTSWFRAYLQLLSEKRIMI